MDNVVNLLSTFSFCLEFLSQHFLHGHVVLFSHRSNKKSERVRYSCSCSVVLFTSPSGCETLINSTDLASHPKYSRNKDREPYDRFPSIIDHLGESRSNQTATFLPLLHAVHSFFVWFWSHLFDYRDSRLACFLLPLSFIESTGSCPYGPYGLHTHTPLVGEQDVECHSTGV